FPVFKSSDFVSDNNFLVNFVSELQNPSVSPSILFNSVLTTPVPSNSIVGEPTTRTQSSDPGTSSNSVPSADIDLSKSVKRLLKIERRAARRALKSVVPAPCETPALILTELPDKTHVVMLFYPPFIFDTIFIFIYYDFTL